MRVIWAGMLLALAACGAPGEPEPLTDMTPPPGTVAVVGGF